MTKRAAKAKSDESGLPEWADNELKNAVFQPLDTINRTGYFLDINEENKKADIQLYESLPDGRTIVEEIELFKCILFSLQGQLDQGNHS